MTLCNPVQGSEGPIHSGHFMLSEVHKDQDANEDFDANEENPFRRRRNSVYKYVRGNVTFFIDRTLNNLFKCLDLAYTGKIPSPRWNIYKDLKLSVKDCIRLNNLIWREWFKQSLLGHKPIVCNLSAPNKTVSDKRPDVVLLEGKYWRRSQQSIQAEYRRWRIASNLSRKNRRRQLSTKSLTQRPPDNALRGQTSAVGHYQNSASGNANMSNNLMSAPTTAGAGFGPPTPLSTFCDYDDDDNMWVADFSDTLFTNLCNNLFEFPDPKAWGPLGNADLIQPGLTQLQPLTDLSPKTPPFLCDLQPTNQGTSSWQTDNDSPLPFLGSLGKRGASSNLGVIINDSRPHVDQSILSSGQFNPTRTTNVTISSQNAELYSTNSPQIINQRASHQGSNVIAPPNVSMVQQQQQQQFNLGTDPAGVQQMYQHLQPVASAYGANANQPQYLSQGDVAGQRNHFLQSQNHNQHQNAQKMPNNLMQQSYFMSAQSNAVDQSFVPVMDPTSQDGDMMSGRRRNHSRSEDMLQQQQQQTQEHIMGNYSNTAAVNSSSNLTNSLARYNPTVASLLQAGSAASSQSMSAESVGDAYGKFPPNGLSRNNSNLMLLSAAASVAASSTLPSGYVDTIPSTAMAPCLLSSNHTNNTHHDISKDSVKNGVKRNVADTNYSMASEMQSKPQPVLRLSTKSHPAAVGSYLISSSSSNSATNAPDIPVVLSNIHRRPNAWANQDPLTPSAPLTPSSAEQMSSGSGLPPKKRPRSDVNTTDSLVSATSASMSHIQYPCKLSPSTAGSVSDFSVAIPQQNLPSAATASSSLLHQRLKYGNSVPIGQQQQQQQPSPQSLQNVNMTDVNTPNASANNARRRIVHIVCESRRRSAITSAMERLSELLPESFAPQNKPNSTGAVSGRGRRAGLSQAALLSCVARYLDELTGEVRQLSGNVQVVREEIDEISLDVSRLQSSLPAVGACKSSVSVAGGRFGTPAGQRSRAIARFDAFVTKRCSESWKFVLLNSLFKPLYPAFLDIVKIDIVASPTSKSKTVVVDMASVREWILQSCSLPGLRQASSQLLLELARASPILVAPDQLPAFLIQSAKR